MTGDRSRDEALVAAARQGDAQAMFEIGTRSEERARDLLVYAREAFRRGADAGSLDAVHALVRLHVAAREYEDAQMLLQDAERRHPNATSQRLISVAPDVLGPLAFDGDGADDYPGAGVFTVISPHAFRAAAASARVAHKLMDVNEHGDIQSEDELPDGTGDIPYTPNFVFDVAWCQYGAEVTLDTKGAMWAPMGRTMVSILVDALAADGIPAHVVGHRPDLTAGLQVWTDPGDLE